MQETVSAETTAATQPTDAAAPAPAPVTETLLAGAETPAAGTEAAPETPAAPEPEPVLDYTGIFPETVAADDPFRAEAVQLFTEHKLAPDVAQKLVEFDVKRQAAATEAWQAHLIKQNADGLAAVKADPELGGEKFNETKAAIALARTKFLKQETVDLLASYGFGNHPELARLLAHVGRSMMEDSTVTGAPATTSRDWRQEWYPSNYPSRS